MKSSSIFIALLLMGFSSSFPDESSSDVDDGFSWSDGFDFVQGMVGNVIKGNIAKMCFGTAGGRMIDSCPKPLQYCDTRNIAMTRCRWNSVAWFLFIGLPLIIIGIIIIIIGVVFYMKKR